MLTRSIEEGERSLDDDMTQTSSSFLPFREDWLARLVLARGSHDRDYWGRRYSVGTWGLLSEFS